MDQTARLRSALSLLMDRWRAVTAAAASILLFAVPALAHTGSSTGGFLGGFAHPLFGPDHVVAMVAVGLWGAFLGAPAIWLLPILFPLVMAFGGVIGILGVPLPGVETAIAVSAGDNGGETPTTVSVGPYSFTCTVSGACSCQNASDSPGSESSSISRNPSCSRRQRLPRKHLLSSMAMPTAPNSRREQTSSRIPSVSWLQQDCSTSPASRLVCSRDGAPAASPCARRAAPSRWPAWPS